MHGDEVVGRELLLHLAVYICDEYASGNKLIEKMLNQTRIHILPSMNPDGWEIASNYVILSQYTFWWTTGSPDPIETDVEKAQIETRMIMEWLESVNFVLSANIHGGDLVANYPFDESLITSSTESITPDDSIFVELAESYADLHPRMKKGIKKCHDANNQFKNGITNGAKWYSLVGGMQDYNYLHTNCFEITLELGCEKFPDASELPRYWKENKMALLNYIVQVSYCIKGTVYGFSEGYRILVGDAIIKVTNITNQQNPIPILHNVRTREDGNYYRLLTKGKYLVTASADGFIPAVACTEITHVPSINHEFLKLKK
ncbi:unnamed protein product [Heterobilharzia americana]|nr:unnamed protein product [Heterobilharzia americana]